VVEPVKLEEALVLRLMRMAPEKQVAANKLNGYNLDPMTPLARRVTTLSLIP